MDAALFESLLHEEESETLDFKSEQYRFSKASEREKSELLKDILGFANAWRRTDAYVLIGVVEVLGGRSRVVGVSEHLQDHALQQFVYSRTNRRVSFGYRALEFEGKQVGVILVRQGERPVWLKADYGKLRKEEVYVRRGSATNPEAPANPDEIAAMRQHGIPSSPNLLVAFGHSQREEVIGSTVALRGENCRIPIASDIPEVVVEDASGFYIAIPSLTHTNSDYYVEFAAYERFLRMAHEVRVVLVNQGGIEARDVLVELLARKDGPVGLYDSGPTMPRMTWSTLDSISPLAIPGRGNVPGYVDVEETEDTYKMEIHFLNVQPGRQVWSENFCVTVEISGTHQLQGHVYAANLAAAEPVELAIQGDVEHTSMTVDRLVQLADAQA